MSIDENTEASPLAATDENFAITAFKKVLDRREQQARNTLGKVASSILAASAATSSIASQFDEPETQYVLDMTKDMAEAIRDGKIKFDTSKVGDTFAQIRQADGSFGPKIPIKEEFVAQGIDLSSIANAVQFQAIQQQLESIVDTLDDISHNIADVIQGQQNDRLGLYYSGVNLYLESCNIENESFRQLVSSQSLKALSDACAQMSLAMQSDAQYLLEGGYRHKKRGQTEEIESRMTNINKCFEAIHRSYVLKAAIYFDMNETNAMLATVEEYGRFLNSAIVPNASRLREFDTSDMLLKDGIWETRAKSICGIEDIRKQLAAPAAYYLEASKEEPDGEEG